MGNAGEVKIRILCKARKMIKHDQKKIVTGILNGWAIIWRLIFELERFPAVTCDTRG